MRRRAIGREGADAAPAGDSATSSVVFAVVAGLVAGAAVAMTLEQLGARYAARTPALAPELRVLVPACLAAFTASAVAETCAASRRPWMALLLLAPAATAYGWLCSAGALAEVTSAATGPAPRVYLVAAAACLAVMGALAGWCLMRRFRDQPTPRRATVTLAACLLPLAAVGLTALTRALLAEVARPERLTVSATDYASVSVWWAVAAVLVGCGTRLPHPAFWLGVAALTGTVVGALRGALAGTANWLVLAPCGLVWGILAVGMVLVTQAAAEARSEAAAAAPKRREAEAEARAERRRPVRRIRRPRRYDEPRT